MTRNVSLLFRRALPKRHAREISTQNIRSHIAMSCNSIIAWKAPLTCTPPPICMSTQSFSNRADLESRECREQSKEYTTLQFSQRLSRRVAVTQIG